MLDTTLHEAAVAFGLALRQAPAVSALRAAAEALEGDPAAQRLIADLRAHQLTLARLQQSGLHPSEEQIDALRVCRAAVRTSLTIMANLRAMNDVKAYLPTVAAGSARRSAPTTPRSSHPRPAERAAGAGGAAREHRADVEPGDRRDPRPRASRRRRCRLSGCCGTTAGRV